MNAAEQRLTAAVRDLLESHRPDGLPAGFTIRAEHDSEKLERPYLVISADNGETPHPAMRKLSLILTTRRRTDDETTGPAKELHQRCVNALEQNLPALATALAAVQLRLRKLVPGPTSEEIVDGRSESSSATWTAWLQIL